MDATKELEATEGQLLAQIAADIRATREDTAAIRQAFEALVQAVSGFAQFMPGLAPPGGGGGFFGGAPGAS